jgi:hypothetical protein
MAFRSDRGELMATHPLHMMDGDSFERVVHLDYCEICASQIPTVVFWRMYHPDAIKPIPIDGRADATAVRQALNAARERTRRHYRRCGTCASAEWMRRTGMREDTIRKHESRERERLRSARRANGTEMRASMAAENAEDQYDRSGEAWFGCALGEQTRVCFRSRNTR